jgi:CRP-like cAMP-binding protein
VDLELAGFGAQDGVELLQKLHLFQRLSFDETMRLSAIMQPVDAPPGDVIIEQDALGDALYVILRGEVSVTRDVGGDGQRQVVEEIGRLREGELFGEMSLIDDVLTSARVTTVAPCRLLKLPRGAFEALLAADAQLAVKVYRAFCRTLSERLRRTSALLARTHALGVVAR